MLDPNMFDTMARSPTVNPLSAMAQFSDGFTRSLASKRDEELGQ
jgi:hypothetical protein